MAKILTEPVFLNPELSLIKEQSGCNVEGSFGIVEIQTEQVEWTFPLKESLREELQLLYGIGEATAFKLNREGYKSIDDLLEHPRWQKAAFDLIQTINANDLTRLARYGASDLQLLSFFQPETIRFIDIETVGLYYIHPVFLIGVLQFEKGAGYIRQFLARDFTEEKAILFEIVELLKTAEVIISYNGRSFDLPYLKGRMRYHNLVERINSLHLDLLRQTRKDYRRILPNCRLLTIESYLLNQARTDDIPGSEIADYYYRYIDSGDPGYLKPVLEHNAIDLLSMAKLLGLLTSKKADKVVGDGK